MSRSSRPISIVAERAVRYLRGRTEPVSSVRLATEVLTVRAGDETSATRLLEVAFAGDPRLDYREGTWRQVAEPAADDRLELPLNEPDPDLCVVWIEAERAPGRRRLVLGYVAAVRYQEGVAVETCTGTPREGAAGHDLRRQMTELIDGAVVATHATAGAIVAFERWLESPVGTPISLRRLGHVQAGLPASHRPDALAARLGLPWRETADRLDAVDALHACLERLREDGETLHDLVSASNPRGAVLDWTKFAFDAAFLRTLPRTPGVYRFYDRTGGLVYVGKSNNLRRRVSSYFRQIERPSPRLREILDRVHRIEVEPSGSDLEAVLREAQQIRADNPNTNVQRRVRPGRHGRSRLDSILILEPAAPPAVLRAYLIRDGRLVDNVGIGPRGGGLKRIERVLRDRFFSCADGPTVPASGPDLDVELIARWIASNRDRVVALDPTDLRTAREVTDRLRWFLAHGGAHDSDGRPILTR